MAASSVARPSRPARGTSDSAEARKTAVGPPMWAYSSTSATGTSASIGKINLIRPTTPMRQVHELAPIENRRWQCLQFDRETRTLRLLASVRARRLGESVTRDRRRYLCQSEWQWLPRG